MREQRTQLLIVGGGVGGVAAALAAARQGVGVIMTEDTDWLGGVLTSQAVPPDEHPWIEQFGCTASYRAWRNGVRNYYRAHYPLHAAARERRYLNPGAARVSGLSHEPRVTVAVLESMLAPYRSAGVLSVLLRHVPIAAEVDGDRVSSVALRDLVDGNELIVSAEWFVDATETGELLALAGAEYVTGTESRAQTGEPHALDEARPLSMQAVSVCFAVDHLEGHDHTIERPARYEEFKAARHRDWPNGPLTLTIPHAKTHQPLQQRFEPNPDDDGTLGPDYADQDLGGWDWNLWTFRRIAARANFVPGAYASDICLVNWEQMDYWGGPVFEVPDEEAAQHVQAARELSLSLLYWLQTEAPRPDGGVGWPGLRLRGDVVGDTADGLAKMPYIRESRRIVAEHTVVEQEISLELRGPDGAERYRDSVGIGCYRIDLHSTTDGGSTVNIGCCPFEVPLGALIPVRLENLLPGAKNIGTTHITNGAYRMPLVEWNVGEVAANLAVFCTDRRTSPRSVRAQARLLDEFQGRLKAAGVELHWPRIVGY